MANSGFGDGTKTDPRVFISAGLCILSGGCLLVWGRRGNRVTCAMSAAFSFALLTWCIVCATAIDDDWVIFAVVYCVGGLIGFLTYTRWLWRLGWVLIGANAGIALAVAILSLKQNLLFSNVEGRGAVLAVLGLIGCGSIYFTLFEGVSACTSVAGSWLFFFGLDMIVNEMEGLAHAARAIFGAPLDSSLGAHTYDPPLLSLVFIGCALLLSIFATLLQLRYGSEPFIRAVPISRENEKRLAAFRAYFEGEEATRKNISAPLEADEKLAAQLLATYAAPLNTLSLRNEPPFRVSFPQSSVSSQVVHAVPPPRLPRSLHFSPSSEKLRREMDDIAAYTRSRRSSAASKYSSHRSATKSFESSSSKKPPSYKSQIEQPKPAVTRPRYESTPIRPQPVPVQQPMRRVSVAPSLSEQLSDTACRESMPMRDSALVRKAFQQADAHMSHVSASTGNEILGRFGFEDPHRKSAWAGVWAQAAR